VNITIKLASLLLLQSALLWSKPTLEVVLNATQTTNPFGLVFDSKGNTYIAEYKGGRILLLSSDGKLRIFSGNGENGFAGDGLDAAEAIYNGIHNLARTSNGDLYISDTRNNLIRMIHGKTNLVHTIAGIPDKKGFSGDGSLASRAMLADPISISLTPDEKTLLVADIQNRRIRAVDLTTGLVRTLAGNGKRGIPKDGENALEQPLTDPRACVMDPEGNLYVMERGGNALRVIRPDGKIFTVAGTGKKGARDGYARKATFAGPKHLCMDSEGKVIIADDNNHLIRLYDPKTKQVSTILGGKAQPRTKLNRPHGVALAPDGALWVCDSWNNRVLILRDY
jgi:sugar lactone lactonase YvrE